MDDHTETSADDRAGTADQAAAAERRRHGSSFGTAAAAYAEHRPDYAEAAIRWALEPVSSRQRLRVIDLAAGTGKLMASLVSLGAEVTAVEPDPDMLAELRRQLPAAHAVPGTAEDIPLPDECADAVLAGQAMHWFDMDRAGPEIARVLTPGGVLAGLWNVDDDRVGWVAEFAEMSKRKVSITLLRWREGGARSWQERLTEAGSGLFHAAQVTEFDHGQARTADSLLATIATHSNFLVMEATERATLLSQVRDFLHARPETSSGEFILPMITVAVRAVRS